LGCYITREKTSSRWAFHNFLSNLGSYFILTTFICGEIGAIESYWSGMNGAYGDMKRPGPSGNYFANAAGIMLSRKQIYHLEEACKGGYLPPYTDGFWHGHSGLKPQNVEFWSGGYHVFSLCGLQRILSLEKDAFSKHLIYHSANNKQEGIARSRLVKADNLLGQLHSVVKAAESHK